MIGMSVSLKYQSSIDHSLNSHLFVRCCMISSHQCRILTILLRLDLIPFQLKTYMEVRPPAHQKHAPEQLKRKKQAERKKQAAVRLIGNINFWRKASSTSKRMLKPFKQPSSKRLEILSEPSSNARNDDGSSNIRVEEAAPPASSKAAGPRRAPAKRASMSANLGCDIQVISHDKHKEMLDGMSLAPSVRKLLDQDDETTHHAD